MKVVLFSLNGHIRTIINKILNDKCKMFFDYEKFLEKKIEPSIFILDNSLKQSQFELLKLLLFNFPSTLIICLFNSNKNSIYKISKNLIFLSKPINSFVLKDAIFESNIGLEKKEETDESLYSSLLIGKSESIKKVKKTISMLSYNNSPVYIFGETGTGKELVAKTLHQNSNYREREMVSLNSSLLNSSLLDAQLFGHSKGAYTGAFENRAGLIERANNSSLFLDEIENLSLDVQSRFLRLFESGEYRKLGETMVQKSSFRLITASNIPIEQLIKEKKFRKDFYYRISLFSIKLPPLREHLEDIPLLVDYYYKKIGEKRSPSDKLLKKLEGLSYMGNVRELNSILERCRVFSEGKIINYYER